MYLRTAKITPVHDVREARCSNATPKERGGVIFFAMRTANSALGRSRQRICCLDYSMKTGISPIDSFTIYPRADIGRVLIGSRLTIREKVPTSPPRVARFRCMQARSR